MEGVFSFFFLGVKFKVVGDVDMDVDGGFLVVWLQELRKMPIAVFSCKIFLSKFHYSPITSNLLSHAWSIKCR